MGFTNKSGTIMTKQRIIRKGTVVQIKSGPKHDPNRKHPGVFVTIPFIDITNNEPSVLIITLDSVINNNPKDPTCIIKGGSHEFIGNYQVDLDLKNLY